MATMSIQPLQIGTGEEDITTNTTMTVIETKQKRAYKRKHCADTTNRSTATEKKKRPSYKRKDCADTTNTSAAMETKKRACRRKDCAGTNTPTVMEIKKKRPYRRKNASDTTNMSTRTKDCGDTNTSIMTEKKKRSYKRKDCSDTNTSTVMETMKRPYRRNDCGGTNTPTVMETKKRKDCGDTNTSTVVETMKRPYRRNDCGGTNTPTVMEIKKKRPYRRNDCGGTNTPTVMEIKKKRPYTRKVFSDATNMSAQTETKKRKDCGDPTNTSTMTENKKGAYGRKEYLPHDLIAEEILTKLPVPSLLKSVLVSKLWYNSIHNDHKRLTYSHFLQSQKLPQVIFSLVNVRCAVPSKTGDAHYACHFFKFSTAAYALDNIRRFDKFRNSVSHTGISELVGYCNGLPCTAQVGNYSTGYMILDPNREDYLYIFYPVSAGIYTPDAHIICHGFGFEPSANEYKLVSIFRTAQKELNFVVFTLGTRSWRNVTATTTPMSAPSGRPITKIRVLTGSDKSAIFCITSRSGSSSSGCLVWKIIATLGGEGSNHIQHDETNAVNNEMEMLLSFNLHDEKFQFIQLPAKTTTDEQQKHTLVDYPHLLEFKGFPCTARIEKISGNGSDYPHRCHDDHQGSGSCCCCCKVHLYILKDKVKQSWVKEETFDVCVNSTPRFLRELGTLAPDPCCFCFGSSTTPPTRILSFSNQMLFYWFNGKHLQVYNLRSGKLQLVQSTTREVDSIFGDKMKEPRHTFIPSDDDIYCSTMDYQLHCHEENFLSLETFIPEGVEGVDDKVMDELDLEREDHPCAAFVHLYRGSSSFYPWFT